MTADRKKPGVAFWASVGLVVLVGYPLSLFPLVWAANHNVIHEGSTAERLGLVYITPVIWLQDNGPAWLNDGFDRMYGWVP